jgi:hypothetical protein
VIAVNATISRQGAELLVDPSALLGGAEDDEVAGYGAVRIRSEFITCGCREMLPPYATCA